MVKTYHLEEIDNTVPRNLKNVSETGDIIITRSLCGRIPDNVSADLLDQSLYPSHPRCTTFLLDGPKIRSFEPSGTSLDDSSAIPPTPIADNTVVPDASDGMDSILKAYGEYSEDSPNNFTDLDDPPPLNVTTPPLTSDLDFDGVFSAPTFDFFDIEHAFILCNTYKFDPPLSDNSDGPYILDDNPINTTYI